VNSIILNPFNNIGCYQFGTVLLPNSHPNFTDIFISSWYDNYMLEGKCKKCGARYYGWALQFPRNQSCPKCGVALDIYEDGQLISKGYSPFTAEKHSINVRSDYQASRDKVEKD